MDLTLLRLFVVSVFLSLISAPRGPPSASPTICQKHMVYLPQEIWEHALGFVDDKSTLSACSLACWGWVRPSQSLLFSEFDMSLSASVEDVERFVQILESSPHLCSYISKLTIASRLLSPFSRLRLPNVRRLKLFGRPLDFTGKWCGLLAFPQLCTLHVHDTAFTSRQFTSLLEALPPIFLLDLSLVMWWEDYHHDTFIPAGIPTGLRLKTLRIDDSQVDGVLKQLLRMADNGDLDLALEDVSLSTTLVFPYINTVDTINALLRRSEALRSVRIGNFHELAHYDYPAETVDFSRNQLLVSATIHLRLSADRSLRRYFDHIARSLCTIESRFLRSMSLDIGVWVSDHALLAECMSSIESALADTRFERVTELRLGVAGPRADGDVYNEAALIQEYLVGIRERGVVVRPRVSDLP